MRLAAAAVCAAWDKPDAGTRKPVLGIPAGPYLAQASTEALDALDAQVAQLRAAGYQVLEIPLLANIDEINQVHRQLIAAEFAQEHEERYPRYRELYRPRTAALIEEGLTIADDVVEDARALQRITREDVLQVMDVHDVDLWLAPAAPGPAPEGIDSTGDPIMNLPWTFMGLPAVTVPAGKAANGLPLGLQLIGSWMMDEEMLAWAQEIQSYD